MKKTYIKPQTSAMELEIESALLDSSTTLKIDPTKTLDSDGVVGAKSYTSEDLWGLDDED